MSETFQPGQTVWHKKSKRACTVLACCEPLIWLAGDGFLSEAENFTADDPNRPEPQKCPFCGSDAEFFVFANGEAAVHCLKRPGCGAQGPFVAARREAVEAWNSIRVVPANTTCHVDVKKGDGALLTADWLANVGLYGSDEFILRMRGDGDQRMAFKLDARPGNDCEWAFHPAYCKTVGDARTLCRLLGVTLKE